MVVILAVEVVIALTVIKGGNWRQRLPLHLIFNVNRISNKTGKLRNNFQVEDNNDSVPSLKSYENQNINSNVPSVVCCCIAHVFGESYYSVVANLSVLYEGVLLCAQHSLLVVDSIRDKKPIGENEYNFS